MRIQADVGRRRVVSRTSAMVASAFLAGGAGLSMPGEAASQAFPSAGGAGAVWETYRFQDEEAVGLRALDLLTLPVTASADLTNAIRLGVSGAWARATMERANGSSETLSGMTDTEVRLSATLGQDAVTLSAVGILPTGVRELSSVEVDLAGTIATDFIPFRISNWGSGGGIGASAAIARPVGTYAVGMSAGYVVAREFDPLESGDFQYRPGNQLHLRAAVDRPFGSSAKGSVSVSWQRFGADEANGANLFQPGDRLQVLGSYSFATGVAGSSVAWVGWLHRAEGEFATGSRLAPTRDLVFGGVGTRIPWGSAVLAPAADVRIQRASEGETGYYMAVGGWAEFSLGGVMAVPELRARMGSVELGSGRSSGFMGVEIGLSLGVGS